MKNMKTLKKIAAAAAAIILVLTLAACGLPFRGPHSGSVVAGKPVDIPGLRDYFTPQNGDLKYGASWHPSYWQHQKMAAELTAYLRVLMGWFSGARPGFSEGG